MNCAETRDWLRFVLKLQGAGACHEACGITASSRNLYAELAMRFCRGRTLRPVIYIARYRYDALLYAAYTRCEFLI
jgi:hypothetical protein